MPPNNWKTVRGSISALDSRITYLSGYHRRYGTNSKNKRVYSVVLSVEKRQTKTGQSSTYIDAEYDCGNVTKKKAVLFISSVRADVAVPVALSAPRYG